MRILGADLRYAARSLAAIPGFTATSIFVIALGIAATVTIFSLVNAVLLRSLPYRQPEKLVYLWSPNPNFKGLPEEMGPNVPDYYDWQRQSHSFSSMTMLRAAALNMVGPTSNTRLQAAYVTPGFFETLGVWPAQGRAFDADNTAVVSPLLHLRIGAQIQLNRKIYTVAGIMPEGFGYPYNGDIPYVSSEFKQTDIWLPLTYTPAQKTDRGDFVESVDAAIGRLRPGISAATAQNELKAIQARVQPLYSDMWKGFTALVRPLIQTIIGPVEQMLWLLLGAVGLVQLIVISNVSNLLFARASARAHELGIRSALGAGRNRIIRQLLTESMLLSITGGAIGLALAYAAVHLLAKLNPGDIPRFDTVSVDNRALFVALILALATGFFSGIAPAIAGSQLSVNELLKRGGNRVSGAFNRGRHALIIFEVALSVILLAGSGLLIRSYLRLAEVDPGFSKSTLTFRLNLDSKYNKPELQVAFFKSFLERLQNIPGVVAAGASNSIPLSHMETMTEFEIAGFVRSKDLIENRAVTLNYLNALGTPLLRGRNFTLQDINSKTPVVLVNKSFVQKFFQGRDPIGGQLRIGIGDISKASWSTIVGVVADIRHNKLEEAAQPQIFQPADNGNNFAIQSRLPVSEPIIQARAALRSLDPVLGLDTVHTMGERITENNARRRFQTSLLTGFAAMAVVLALVGLYGLMAYSVRQRRTEIGIRLAVGSSQMQVLTLILSHGLRLTAAGLIVGLACSVALTRFLSSWLFGISAFDPATFIGVTVLFLIVGCCACLIPAWSATRINPAETLQQQ
jgi:putative ABC transport system permease protein